ncbi:MAG TPA: GtrA family protein [Zoogloea sp.]|jgi:putative flippase GtrA|nr:GtrA family protein [Zoogloea sp.]HQX05227.1 GtrA family protein [Zoogloea sp.]
MGAALNVQMLRQPAVMQFIRFGLIGAVNTSISYGIYALLLYMGLNYALANLGSLILGIGVSFFSQGRFVFGNASIDRLPRFILLWGSLYLVNIGLIALFMRFGINAYLGGALALVPITLLSFVCQRYLVFRPASARQ